MADPAPVQAGGFGFGSEVPETTYLTDYETRYGGPLVDDGFGNPTDTPWTTYSAAISPLVSPLPGYGNEFISASSSWVPIGMRILPDSGAPLVELWGTWWDTTFRVRLRENGGSNLYPAAPDYAESAVPGQTQDIAPNPPLEFLRFTAPAAPPGNYDVIVYWGANFATSLVLEDVLEVLYRTRQQAVYQVRNALPPNWVTGPRSAAEEELL